MTEIFGNRMIGRSGNSANRKVGVFFAGSGRRSWGICRRFELEKLPFDRFGRSNMSILLDVFMNIRLTCSGVFCMAISGEPAAVHSCVPDRCRCRAAAVCGGFRSGQIVGAFCRPAAGRSGRFSGWDFSRSAFRRLSGRIVRLVFCWAAGRSRWASPRLASFPLGGCSVVFRSGWYAGRLSGRLRLVPPRIVAAGHVCRWSCWRSCLSRLGWACFASVAGRSVWCAAGIASAGLLLGLLRLGRCPAGVGASSRPVGLPAAFPAVLRSVGWSVIRSAFRLGFVPARFGVGYALGAAVGAARRLSCVLWGFSACFR